MYEARVTPCNHFFHGACLKKWLYVQQSCPMCHWDLNFKTRNDTQNNNLNNNQVNNDNGDDEEGYSSEEQSVATDFNTVSEISDQNDDG